MSARLSGKFLYTIGISLGVVASLVLGQLIVSLVLIALPLSLNPAVVTTIAAAFSYVLGLAIAIGIPVAVSKKAIDWKTLGIGRLVSWSDIGLGIMSVLPYYLLAGALLWVGIDILKVINPEVGQQIAFQNLNLRIEYVVAFLTLVVIAPFAEELLFRGYFLGRLSETVGKWVSVIITAVVFGLLHLPGFTESGVVLQWGAAVDTFALGLVAGILRQLSGSIWAGVILHAIKNGIAFYFLFIAPLYGGR